MTGFRRCPCITPHGGFQFGRLVEHDPLTGNGRWRTTTSRCSGKVRSWSKQRQGQGARQAARINSSVSSVAVMATPVPSARVGACTLSMRVKGERKKVMKEEMTMKRKMSTTQTMEACSSTLSVRLALCPHVGSLVSSISGSTVVRLHRSCLSVGRVLSGAPPKADGRKNTLYMVSKQRIQDNGYKSSLAKRVVAPGGWLHGSARLPCTVC